MQVNAENGQPPAPPAPELAGHLAIYRTPDGQGLLCFRPDGASDDEVIRQPMPGLLLGPLVQALTGQVPDLGSSGPLGLMKRMVRGG